MKKTLLFVLALAVIPTGITAQVTATNFERARALAEQGDALAQVTVAGYYREGEGVEQDFTEAAHWFHLAADQGDASAQNNLGIAYATGRIVPEDIVVSHMWFNVAAAQGHEDAQENKDSLERRMTHEQVAEGQELAREWIEAHPPGGD